MRRTHCTVLVTALPLLLLGRFAPSWSFAFQDDHGSPATVQGEHAGDGQAAEHAAEPNILSGDIGNIFFTLLIFLSVVFILGRFAWKPLLGALQKREEFIRKSIEDAKKERQEADKLLAQYKVQIDKAREEATAIVEEGRRDAEQVRKRLQHEARKEADETIARGKREIELASANAIKEIYDRTANLAVEVAGRIVDKTLSPEDHQGLVAESLDRMKASAN